MVLKAARTVDASISDIASQQKWMWTRIHNMSLTRCMGKEKDGGLRKLREELEAENSGVQIPAEIRWLGGAKVRARFQEKKEGASSVVAAVLGEATFNHLCRYSVRLLGVKHDVDAYEEVRPNAFCTRCSRWGHIAPHCSSSDPKCFICSGDHEATNHRCPVEGCKVGRGRPCPHGAVKCVDCGEPHGARADACVAKRERGGMLVWLRGKPGWRPVGGDHHPQSGGRRARSPRFPRTEPQPPRGKRRVRWRSLCRRREKRPLMRLWRWRSRRRRLFCFLFFLFFSLWTSLFFLFFSFV